MTENETCNDSDNGDLDRKPAARVIPKSSNAGSSQKSSNVPVSIDNKSQGSQDDIENGLLQRCSHPDSTQDVQSVNSNDKGSIEYHPCLISKNILNDYSPKALHLHRVALLQLFNNGNYHAKRLTAIAQKCGLNDQKKRIFKMKEMFLNNGEYSSNYRPSIDVDPSLPQAIGSFALQNKYNALTTKGSIFRNKQKFQSLGMSSEYSAMNLTELEESIREWYNKAMLSRDYTHPPIKRKPTFFTLRFSEGSLSMLSKWACINAVNNMSSISFDERSETEECNSKSMSSPVPKQTINDSKLSNVATVVRQPTVDARFRKCSICSLWGHYEIECSKMSYETILRLGDELETMLTKKGLASSDPHLSQPSGMDKSQPNSLPASSKTDSVKFGGKEHIACDTKNDDFGVTVEIFDGFIFEQRSEPETFRQIPNPGEEKNSSNFSKYDDSFIVDGFKIKAASSLACLQDGKSPQVVPESKELKKKRKRLEKQRNKYQLMKNQRKTGSRTNFSFFEGDVVAWYPNRGNENQDVFTGLVVKVPKPDTKLVRSKMILVEFLASIPSAPTLESIGPVVDFTVTDHVCKTGISRTSHNIAIEKEAIAKNTLM
jgi:hypothetical protein